jgi:hypothetical protein
MSHPGVPPPRVLLIYHSSYWAVAAHPVDVSCHKVIDGDESGAKKTPIVNPTFRYTIYTLSIPSSLEIVVPGGHHSPTLTLTHHPKQNQKNDNEMHAGQVSYTPYQQLDGETEREMTEIVCRNYPHPQPVAIDDLSSEHKEILESVSLLRCAVQGARLPSQLGLCVDPKTDHCFRARARLYTQTDHTRKSRASSGTPWKDAPVRGHL